MAKRIEKLRLDQLLVKRDLAASGEKARGLILAGKVKIGDELVSKAGRLFPEDCDLEVLGDSYPYVSRGGVKLEQALRGFALNPKDRTAVDVGASTGGFVDCLLQHGAKKVFAIDVGYGQLDWKLQKDARVVVLDRQNIRYLNFEKIGSPVDLVVIDVSFISLRHVIPRAIRLLKREGDLVALVKPQFEVGREEVEKKGIIRDLRKHATVLCGLRGFIQDQSWALCNVIPSPITGKKGNREFFIHCVFNQRGKNVDNKFLNQAVELDSL